MRAPLLRLLAPLALLAVVLFPVSAYALAVPPVPGDIPIVDQTNTLTPDQKTDLANVIAAERQHSGNQIGVLIIPSLQGEALEDYSLQVARTWGIGTKERDSGVLLFIAKNDHQLRIDVGYGLEGALPDIRAGQIIRDRITPDFRQGKYYEGIKSGLEGITMAIHNEVDPQLNASTARSRGPKIPWEAVFFAIFIIPTWLASMLGRTKSWWAGGVLGGIAGVVLSLFVGFLFWGIISIVGLTLIGLLFDKVVSDNYRKSAAGGTPPSWWAGGPWIGGGGSDGGGGGGFGGFGGGGFGGGGASGSW